jgi:hypothetical protein
MPDRFFEHPHTVLVVTNLTYADAPALVPSDPERAATLNWQEVRLAGTSSHEFGEQIEALGPVLSSGWQTTPGPKTGNPVPETPSVLVIYRRDHEFLLDGVVPGLGGTSRRTTSCSRRNPGARARTRRSRLRRSWRR